jgi:hypothetical protein
MGLPTIRVHLETGLFQIDKADRWSCRAVLVERFIEKAGCGAATDQDLIRLRFLDAAREFRNFFFGITRKG